MKTALPLYLFIGFLAGSIHATAQKVDSIFFNLYTDSLKKGTFNYINVDGKLSDGHYLPMTIKEIDFSASSGKFEGNCLYLPPDFREEKVTVKAVLKANTALQKEITIYIKKMESTEPLKRPEDVMNGGRRKRA